MEPSPHRFAGRTAIVTGGSSGIGRAIAQRLASEGAAVVIADVKTDQGLATAREAGKRARFVACDVSQSADVRAMIDFALAETGGIDILVNNAGVPGTLVPVDRLEEADWERSLAVNLGGVFRCTKYAVPALEASPAGAIVSIASTFGMIGAPLTPAYAAAKGGIIGLTRQLAVDLGPRGIRVNAVAPGYVDNDMDDRRSRMAPDDAAANLAARAAAAALQPLGRQADVREIAAAVAFLASSDASFMTGAVVPVDGGCTAFFNLGRRT
jgi:NAD(P)-dependent dehydrogenase (short-subunit alcohol dehydrogenase family)